MKAMPVLILAALMVGGCATSSASRLPVCDGQHRRPANPHGSVLDVPAAGAAASAAPVAPQAPPSPGCGS
jgi:type IV secretion system protein VirB7